MAEYQAELKKTEIEKARLAAMHEIKPQDLINVFLFEEEKLAQDHKSIHPEQDVFCLKLNLIDGKGNSVWRLTQCDLLDNLIMSK